MSNSGLHILRSDEAASDGSARVGPTVAVGVLLVEDDAAIVSPLRETLLTEGLEVTTAANGRDALLMLRGGLRPSLIVLDLMMPVMDGWDFRNEQLCDVALKDIPVLVMTATGFSPETIRAQFGNVDVLPKPVPYSALLEVLGRARGSRSSAG